jgi:hypothetical protein
MLIIHYFQFLIAEFFLHNHVVLILNLQHYVDHVHMNLYLEEKHLKKINKIKTHLI